MDTILYVGPEHESGDPLGLLKRSGARRLADGSVLCVVRGTPPFQKERRFVAVSDPEHAAAFAHHNPVDALVLDTRVLHFRSEVGHNPSESGPFENSRVGRVLARLFPEGEVSGAIRRDRVVGLVGPGEQGAETAFCLGAGRAGTVLSSPTLEQLLERIEQVSDRGTGGRVALCLAGGGIEGLFYELGVLRALESFLGNRSVVDFDLFCGISAGAVIGSFLANGIGPDEVARGMAGDSARLLPPKRSELFDLNLGEAGWRLFRLLRETVRGGSGPRGLLSSVARAVPSAFFAGQGLRHWLERNLQRPGMTDRFDELRRPLYVGATDQDSSSAVVFGEPGLTHVPIHRAVRASSALVPFYAPEQIEGRYYIDGAFTRTTNMRVAVRNGATLVILVDPLVPSVSEHAGHVHARGGIFGTMQGLKGLVNGRFDKAVHAIREMFPDVAFYLFRPEGEEMRILSGNPMKYFYRPEVEAIAFENTARKIRSHFVEMSRDFAAHGITLRDPEAQERISRPPHRFEPSALGV
jgi:predicted acylesterase/phospholipase RssA